MARNTLHDLNDHLFSQLERLNDEDLTQEELDKEIGRSKAMNGVAKNIIDNARTALEGAKMIYEKVDGNQQVPGQFKLKDEN